MGQDFHFVHVPGEEHQVMPDERLDALLRVGSALEGRYGSRVYFGKALVLDQEQQFVLAANVMVDPRQAHSRGPRQVSHRGGVVSPLGEDRRCCRYQLLEPAIAGGHRPSERSFGRNLAPLAPRVNSLNYGRFRTSTWY